MGNVTYYEITCVVKKSDIMGEAKEKVVFLMRMENWRIKSCLFIYLGKRTGLDDQQCAAAWKPRLRAGMTGEWDGPGFKSHYAILNLDKSMKLSYIL